MIDVTRQEYLRNKRTVSPEPQTVLAGGPRLEIVHLYQPPGVEFCVPGEEISAAWLESGERKVQLKLSLALRLLLDNIARHRFARTASQIEASLRTAFYSRHGSNVRTSTKQTRRFTRASIKVYVQRIRQALWIALDELGADSGLDPSDILVSEPMIGGGVGYRLRRVSVHLVHLSGSPLTIE